MLLAVESAELTEQHSWPILAAVSDRPVLYLLSGLPCSGKSTNARELERNGIVRIPVDEMMIESVGRLGIDHEPKRHTELLTPVVAEARETAISHLLACSDVAFDHGLGRRAERDDLKRRALDSGAAWKLLWFDAAISTLRRRCSQRFDVPGTVPITDQILDHLAVSWERPAGEGETVIATD